MYRNNRLIVLTITSIFVLMVIFFICGKSVHEKRKKNPCFEISELTNLLKIGDSLTEVELKIKEYLPGEDIKLEEIKNESENFSFRIYVAKLATPKTNIIVDEILLLEIRFDEKIRLYDYTCSIHYLSF